MAAPTDKSDRHLDVGDDEISSGFFEVMRRIVNPGTSCAGEESKQKAFRHYENIFRYEELVFNVLNQLASQSSVFRAVGSRKLALQELETVFAANLFESSVVFERFEETWDEDGGHQIRKNNHDCDSTATIESDPFVEPWYDIRGEMGETVLDWTWLLKIRYYKHEQFAKLLGDLLVSMLKSKPYLAEVAHNIGPRAGQTILHQACAEGDAPLVKAIIDTGFMNLDKRMANAFCEEVLKMPSEFSAINHIVTPTSTTSKEFVYSQSPLEVAMLAPTSCKASVEVVHMLLDAGADPIVYEDCMETDVSTQGRASRKVLFTLLHVLARGRWDGCGPYHVSESRCKAILALLLDRESPMYGKVPADKQNFWGFTPLQAAAAFGNEVFFVEMLEWMKVYVQEWGSMQTYGFPLKELDSAACSVQFCSLECMAMFGRSNLLDLGICDLIIRSKWSRFGLPCLRLTILVELFVLVCTVIVVVDDTTQYHLINWWCRTLALAVAISTLVIVMLLFVFCGNSEAWFRNMPLISVGQNYNRISFLNLMTVSSCRHLFCMSIMVLTVPWANPDWEQASPLYVSVWHTLVCIWWLDYITHTLRFLQLFESTGALASALPEIFKKDMAPFMCIYAIVFLCSSLSLRVSTSTHHSDQTDEKVGSWWNTIKTMEESIHGPDVEWRHIVTMHPMAAPVFITFLWLTLMMVTILVAMFTSRYDTLRAQSHERFVYNRTLFVITLEKLIPLWYHKRAKMTTGRPLGILVEQGKRAVRKRHRRTSFFKDALKLRDADENTPLVDYNRVEDRWVIVKGNDLTFNRWRSRHGAADDDQV